MGEGFFRQSEGALLKSDNLLSEPDPEKIHWKTLPDGEVGLRTPPGGGPIAEEQSYVVLSDGSFHVTYRSIDGYPVESYSRDGGHTWSTPRYKRYTDGRKLKNPRAANFVWKCRNGKYLYWFHNHGGHFIRDMWGQSSETNGLVKNGNGPYDDRNPVWLSAGLEVDTPAGREIAWSEPEIALYDHDPFVRISYPDLVEEDGRDFLSETQKDIARVHEIPAAMLDGMWTALAATLGQERGDLPISADKCLINLPINAGEAIPAVVPLPEVPWLPHFRTRNWQAADYRGTDSGEGAALEVWVTLPTLDPGQALLDNRDAAGCGFCLCTVAGGAVELTLCDGQTENHWTSDPVLQAGRRHHVVVNVDGGPRIISYIIDGRFCDGGETRQFGWGRFSPYLRHVNAARELRVARQVDTVRLYTRPLRTAEAIRHFRVGDRQDAVVTLTEAQLAAPDWQMRDGLRNSRGRFLRERHGRVAFLGGSITAMKGWRHRTQDLLREQFPETGFVFHNAGIGGTNSTFGVFRFDADVAAKGPIDLLFLEFAVNDSSVVSPDNQRQQAMEGILRKARRSNPRMDIVVLYLASEPHAQAYRQRREPAVITHHEQVMRHYGIPTVNLALEMTRRLDAGRFAWGDFSGDSCHPTPFGHGQYLDCLREFLALAWAGEAGPETPYSLPAPLLVGQLETAGLVGVHAARLARGWEEVSGWQAKKVCNYDGPVDVLAAVSPGAELELTFTGSSLAISAIAGMDAGILQVAVDGAPPTERDLFDEYCRWFHRPVFCVLAHDLPVGQHRVTLRMAERRNPLSAGHAARILKFGIS